MANEEAFTLAGLALNDGTTFGVTEAQAPVPRQRQDWIGAADSEAQLLFRNPLHENRKITLRIAVVPQSTMDLAHDKILLVLDKLQSASKTPDGISLTWTPATGTRTVTFTVYSGEIVDLPIDWQSGWLAKSPEFTIEMTCHPYWTGAETLTTTASSSTPFVTKEITGVTGDVPALGRLIVTDTATQSRRHVEWGIEGQFYNSGTSLILDSDSLVTSGFAGAGAVAVAAYDPNAAGNNAVSVTLGTQLVAICGTGNQSHVGTYRVKARVYSDSKVWVRLSWQTGDGPFAANDYVNQPVIGFWSEVDLGTITVPTAVVGTQRWSGRVEAFALTSGVLMYVDYLTLIPVAEGYGKARATYSYSPGVGVANDSFVGTTAAAALNARAAPAGGTWATSGDATDFVFADNFIAGSADGIESIVRSTTAVETSGRYAILGSTNYTDVQVDARARIGTLGSFGVEQALIVRWTDASNHLRFVVPDPNGGTVRLEQVVAGVVAVLGTSGWVRTSQTSYRLRLLAFVSGRVLAQVRSDAGTVLTEIQSNSTAVATAGTLATGKPGLRDRSLSTSPASRYFTEFTVSTPAAEPIVVYSGRNMQIRYGDDTAIRQDSTGTYSGRPQSYRGSQFLVPVGTSRVIVKARRNDIDAAPDENVVDATQIQIGWTPRGLAVPR